MHITKDNKAALLRYIIPIPSTLILYHKLPKSPVFLQATVHNLFVCNRGDIIADMARLPNKDAWPSPYILLVLS